MIPLDGFDKILKWGFAALCVSVPLAIWKAAEIAIWIARNISVTWGG